MLLPSRVDQDQGTNVRFRGQLSQYTDNRLGLGLDLHVLPLYIALWDYV